MTNEEAIAWLNTNDFESAGYAEATKTAIKALEHQKIEQMKKEDLFIRRFFLVSMAIVIVMMIIGLMITYYERHPHPQKYPMTTVVTHVSRATDTVTVQDFNGNLWQFKGAEDWDIGDVCSCIMSDNGTELIDDDKIVKVKYDGWFSGWK